MIGFIILLAWLALWFVLYLMGLALWRERDVWGASLYWSIAIMVALAASLQAMGY